MSADGVISSLKATLESLRRERDTVKAQLATVTAERDKARADWELQHEPARRAEEWNDANSSDTGRH